MSFHLNTCNTLLRHCNIETVKEFTIVLVNTSCYIHAIFSLVFQIIWIGKNFKHSKIIIYVGSTVCEGGGGGQEVILTLLICEGAGEEGGRGDMGGRMWVWVGTEESM